MQTNVTDLNQIIDSIYDAALRPEKWTDLLQLLGDHIDIQDIGLKITDDSTKTLEMNSSDRSSSIEQAGNSLAQVMSQIPELTIESGIDSNNDNDNVDINRILGKHFMRALQITQSLINSEQQNELIVNFLDKLPVAVFIVDQQLNIYQSNRHAGAYTHDSSVLKISNDQLSLKQLSDQKKLCELVAALANIETTLVNQLPLVTDDPESEDKQLIIIGTPIKISSVESKHLVALFVSNRKSQPLPTVEVLSEIYHLTNKEAEITRLLLHGYSINEISELTEVSKHTVRNQVKSIMSKTETSRQAELVSLILTGPGSLNFDNRAELAKLGQSGRLTSFHTNIHQLDLDSRRVISWQEYGDLSGRPVIFGHSSLGSSYEISRQQDQLLKQLGLRLIAPDRPGRCQSSPDMDMNLSSLNTDLDILLNHLNIDTFSYIGFEMGALFGAAYAAANQSRLKKLVVVSTGFMPASAAEWKQMSPFFRTNLKCAMYFPKIHRLFTNMMVHGIKYNPQRFLNTLAKQFSQSEKKFKFSEEYKLGLSTAITSSSALASMLTLECQMPPGPWDFEITDIVCEIEQWHGMEDSFVPVLSAQRLADSCHKGARQHFVENEGRFIFYTRFEDIVNSLVT
ncbi:hypothetical protein MNBD_GAMMA12-1592 [hydrothermal vent metagenome]|uniref:HTH luxR-type domain-containing protein n=1 Tax=hydrothermal vent metagenome TaxID=652676 RepID=A0A3B0Y4T8_9ZZZZ